MLVRLLDAAIRMERQGDEIRYRVLVALAHHAMENTQTAMDFIGQALILAEPQGYIRLFVDEGQPMAELLVPLSRIISRPTMQASFCLPFPKM